MSTISITVPNLSIVLLMCALIIGAAGSCLGAYVSYLRLKSKALRAAADIIEASE